MSNGFASMKDFREKYPYTGLRFFITLASLLAIIAGGLNLFVIFFYSGPSQMIYIGIAYIVLGLLLFFTKLSVFSIFIFTLALFDRFYLLTYQGVDESLIYSVVISAVFFLGMIACIIYKSLYRKFEKAKQLRKIGQFQGVSAQVSESDKAQNARKNMQKQPSPALPLMQTEAVETPSLNDLAKDFTVLPSGLKGEAVGAIAGDELADIPAEAAAIAPQVESPKNQIIRQNSEYNNGNSLKKRQSLESGETAAEEREPQKDKRAINNNILVDSDYQSELFDQINLMLQSEKPIPAIRKPIVSDVFSLVSPVIPVAGTPSVASEAEAAGTRASVISPPLEEKVELASSAKAPNIPEGTFGEERVNYSLEKKDIPAAKKRKPHTELWGSSDSQQGSAADSIG